MTTSRVPLPPLLRTVFLLIAAVLLGCLAIPGVLAVPAATIPALVLPAVLMVVLACGHHQVSVLDGGLKIVYFPLYRRIIHWDQLRSLDLVTLTAKEVRGGGFSITNTSTVLANRGGPALRLTLEDNTTVIVVCPEAEAVYERWRLRWR